MTTVGFTGARTITPIEASIVEVRLRQLVAEGMEVAVTGACTGVDEYVARWLATEAPTIQQTIVVPGCRQHVSTKFLDAMDGFKRAELLYMPKDSTYRERNIVLVSLADVVEAFWKGNKRSGTWMTVNIAKRERKLGKVTMI